MWLLGEKRLIYYFGEIFRRLPHFPLKQIT